MADGDRQLAFTTGPVPTSVQVSGPDRVTPKAVNASFDGTGAAGDFLPCLIITGRTGQEVARIPAPKVAAGASAEVSWFPRVGGAGASVTPAAPYAAYDHTETVPTATQTLLTWRHALGPHPLDLTAPTLPTFIATGIYSVTVAVFCFVPVAGAFAEAALFDTLTSLGAQSFPLSDASPGTIPACSISATRRFTAGDLLGVNFFHNAGVNKSVELFANVQAIGT